MYKNAKNYPNTSKGWDGKIDAEKALSEPDENTEKTRILKMIFGKVLCDETSKMRRKFAPVTL
jgi:hypothetical protein